MKVDAEDVTVKVVTITLDVAEAKALRAQMDWWESNHGLKHPSEMYDLLLALDRLDLDV